MLGCEGEDTISIIVHNNPTAAISPPSPAYICKGSDLQLNGNPSGGQGPYTHLWSGDIPGDFNQYIVNPVYSDTSSYGELIYRVTDANNCQARDTIEINVNELFADILQDTIDIYVIFIDFFHIYFNCMEMYRRFLFHAICGIKRRHNDCFGNQK